MGISIQQIAVQLIELQGNRGGSSMSRQNSQGTGIVNFVGATPLQDLYKGRHRVTACELLNKLQTVKKIYFQLIFQWF